MDNYNSVKECTMSLAEREQKTRTEHTSIITVSSRSTLAYCAGIMAKALSGAPVAPRMRMGLSTSTNS
jgi:hypothetical protein